MSKLKLVHYPDVVLKKRSDDVTRIDGELVDFIGNMAETMYAENGIGLAAPQVAQNIRVITVDVTPEEQGKTLMHLINPVIVDSHGRTTYQEGCLSFPGISAEVRRKDKIHVVAYNRDGKELDIEADGLLSICIQHEIDHLNGVCFVDRLNPVQKKLVLREYISLKEEREDDEAFDAIRAVHGK